MVSGRSQGFPITGPSAVESTRRRLIATLFAGNAIGSTAYIGIATVSALIAEEITGSTSLAGLPATTGTLGVAIGAGTLSWAAMRHGRRPTFTLGYVLSSLGAALAIVSIVTNSFPLLLAGMVAVGFGRSVGQLARYAAGDMRSEARRAEAISFIVWASTIGAVIGPLMIGPTSAFAVAGGANELVGPVSVAVVGFALGAILMVVGLRPDPITLVIADEEGAGGDSARPFSELLAAPSVRLSIAAIVVSQMVMVLVMVMTPVHIKANDGGLAVVGWVMMAHTIGMFAIAPVTGMLIDRFGPRSMILTSVGIFVGSCVLATTAVTASTPILLSSMFLLGVAWNFGFVAGSTLLQHGLAVPDRLKLQGFADSSAWITSAFAAGISGVIVTETSYTSLAMFGALLALIPLIPLASSYRPGAASPT
jgi:MFS family permease